MIDPINTGDVSRASEHSTSPDNFNQNLINQLLMFILGCNSGPSGRSSPQENVLKAELTQLESSLPPEQAAQLKEMLADLPTDTSSKNYHSELTEAFTKITAFVASNIPNGLSPQAKEDLNALLGKMPIDTSSKDYGINVASWAAQISAFVASNLPGVLSPTAQQELKHLLEEEPTDTSSKDYPADMVKFIDQVQVFLAENMPTSLSQADKDKLDAQLKKIQSIDVDSKTGPEELQLASAQLQQMLSGMFF
ncbi:MAG: hypothetical protein KFB93_05095 [Simkaniaceae bacterium]|nr:MAG: hypothetical protein KFB93_05095 [Simkaniaceae bacterium]